MFIKCIHAYKYIYKTYEICIIDVVCVNLYECIINTDFLFIQQKYLTLLNKQKFFEDKIQFVFP